MLHSKFRLPVEKGYVYHLIENTMNPSNGRISKHNKDEVLEQAEKDLAMVVNQYISRLVKELQGTDFWKLRHAYSPGVCV